MNAGKKLAIGGLIIVGVTAYMAYLGASSSWQYYVSVDECLQRRSTFEGLRLRVNGKVAVDSLRIDPDGKRAVFSLDGEPDDLPVVCSGTLPDNLAENIDVVVEGRLDESGVLQGDKLLTRCAGKYDSEDASAPSKAAPSKAAPSRRDPPRTDPSKTAARGRSEKRI